MATVSFRKTPEVSPEIAKQLPQNIEAERSVLGAVLLDGGLPNAALAAADTKIHPGDFFLPQHRNIYVAMLAIEEDRKPIDPVTLLEQLGDSLDAVGGAGYVAQLTDGVPRVTNVAHYADIISLKSRLRQIIYRTQEIQTQALDAGANPTKLSGSLAEFAKRLGNGSAPALVQVDFREMLTMELPPREFVLEPLLSSRGHGMIYSARGAGKTYVTLEIAYDIAAGIEDCFMWRVPKARRVTYVDGEMSIEELQDRLRVITRIHDVKEHPRPEEGMLKLVARDMQKEVRPRINTREGRSLIEDTVEPGSTLILDNLASLGQSSDEKETEDWAALQDWINDLCWRGISVIIIHHAGKSGTQRGSSKREDLLEFVVNLKLPSGDYSPEQGLRVECHLEKKRGKLTHPKYGQPFEISLGLGEQGHTEWLLRPLRELLRKRAVQMLEDGMRPNDVAQETGLTRWTIARLVKKDKSGMIDVGREDA